MTHSFRRSAALVAYLLGAVVVLSGGRQALPSGRELVQRSIAATGGEAAYKALKSIRRRGQFEMTGQNISATFEEFAARPEKLLLRAEITGIGKTEQGFDGKTAWTIDPQTGPRVLKDRERDELVADADFDAALHRPDHIKELKTLARQDFDGHQAYKVHVILNSGVEQDEYFDTQSGLQVGWEGTRATQLGVVPATGMFRDYKKFGLLLQPTAIVQKALFIEQVLRVTSVEYDVVPANAFEPPASIKALVK